MRKNLKDKATLCVHAGAHHQNPSQGVNTPVYTSSAFGYLDTEETPYPRYFNTPNQQVVVEKLCALEGGQTGLLCSSGMAAVSTTMLGLLRPGDHVVLQNDLYGGTYHFAEHTLSTLGIDYTFVPQADAESFREALRPNTKMLYIETPSNPLLKITDIEAIARLAQSRNIVSVIDNTFASPINQNPISLGIDVAVHSGTKYLGGHSDLCFGAIITSAELKEKIYAQAINLGGSVNATTCALIERSLKTLSLRVQRQNENAQAVAEFLADHPSVRKVNYPGLKTHEGHHLAAQQMAGFGGMLSFEPKLSGLVAAEAFMRHLQLITPALSLGGVETLICSPARTSHSKMSAEARAAAGVKDELLRVSIGIENAGDLINDLQQALEKIANYSKASSRSV